jgi:response regulator of citrate/malate metabolism
MKLANILIVEDEAPDRELLSLFFAVEKFANRIYFAHTVAEARQRVEHTEIDLMLLDVNLPDGCGIELAQEMNASRAVPCPVVCLSGDSRMETLRLAEKAGVMAFIEKPLTFALLRELMQKIEPLHLGLMLG